MDAAQPRRAQQALVAVPGVLSVAQIGKLLRVLMADVSASSADDTTQRLRDALAQAGLEAEVTAGTPNLEDVFVSATSDHPAEERQTQERAA